MITLSLICKGGRINLFRTIFSKEELGVVQFQQLRKKEQNEFKNNEEVTAYKQKVIQDFDEMFLCDKRDSLKKIIHLMDGDTEEITPLKSFLVKYHHDYHNTIHHVNQYCFGAGIMRMLYLHNLPDVAMQVSLCSVYFQYFLLIQSDFYFQFFDDPDLKSIFEQQQTYKVFLDLLLENERYAEVLEYYKEIRRRLDLYGQYPDPTINLLGFAACYHLVVMLFFTAHFFCFTETFLFTEYARFLPICAEYMEKDPKFQQHESNKILFSRIGT